MKTALILAAANPNPEPIINAVIWLVCVGLIFWLL
jgi:hypothetical protein